MSTSTMSGKVIGGAGLLTLASALVVVSLDSPALLLLTLVAGLATFFMACLCPSPLGTGLGGRAWKLTGVIAALLTLPLVLLQTRT